MIILEPLHIRVRTSRYAPFSCTPCVQQVHTKAEVERLTPSLLDFGVLLNCHA